ncbi:hypothetical protein C3Y89_24275 [Rhizobium sp. UPM1132]|nr:hypothetical protein [Rhizobium ruizarguesonis]
MIEVGAHSASAFTSAIWTEPQRAQLRKIFLPLPGDFMYLQFKQYQGSHLLLTEVFQYDPLR